MKHFFLINFLIFLCCINISCARVYISEAETTVDHLMIKIEEKLTQKYDMEAIGVSVSMPRGIIKGLGFDFNIKGPLSKDKLRSIIINSTRDFVDHVNSDQEIKHFLKNNCFRFNNIEITLFVKDSNGYGIEHPDFGLVGIFKGRLSYKTVIYKKDLPYYEIEERESYEEALKIVQAQTTSKS